MWKLCSTTELLGLPLSSGWEAQKVMLKDCFISSPHSLLVLSLTSVGKCVLNLKKKSFLFYIETVLNKKKVVKLDKMTHILCFTYLFYVLTLTTYIYWTSILGDSELRTHDGWSIIALLLCRPLSCAHIIYLIVGIFSGRKKPHLSVCPITSTLITLNRGSV